MLAASLASHPSHRQAAPHRTAGWAVHVTSAPDLRAALRQARGRNLHIVASARDATYMPDAHSVFIDTSTLDRVLGLDAERGRVEVQSGVRWPALAANLAARLDPPLHWVLPDEFGAGTVGGTVAENAAGKSLVTQSVAAITQALALVGADGELRRASREINPSLFRAAIGGHGAFGVIYSVTLQLSRTGVPPLNQDMEAFVKQLNSYVAALCTDHARPAVSVELLVSPGRAEETLAGAAAVLHARGLALASAQVRLISQNADTLLPWAQSPCVSIELGFARRTATLSADVCLAQSCRELVELALARGGCFRLGNPYASREHVESGYPDFAVFLAEALRCDPTERFTNPWLRHHRNLFRRMPCDVRWGCQSGE